MHVDGRVKMPQVADVRAAGMRARRGGQGSRHHEREQRRREHDRATAEGQREPLARKAVLETEGLHRDDDACGEDQER